MVCSSYTAFLDLCPRSPLALLYFCLCQSYGLAPRVDEYLDWMHFMRKNPRWKVGDHSCSKNHKIWKLVPRCLTLVHSWRWQGRRQGQWRWPRWWTARKWIQSKTKPLMLNWNPHYGAACQTISSKECSLGYRWQSSSSSDVFAKAGITCSTPLSFFKHTQRLPRKAHGSSCSQMMTTETDRHSTPSWTNGITFHSLLSRRTRHSSLQLPLEGWCVSDAMPMVGKPLWCVILWRRHGGSFLLCLTRRFASTLWEWLWTGTPNPTKSWWPATVRFMRCVTKMMSALFRSV